jgi:hypothetical protein
MIAVREAISAKQTLRIRECIYVRFRVPVYASGDPARYARLRV